MNSINITNTINGQKWKQLRYTLLNSLFSLKNKGLFCFLLWTGMASSRGESLTLIITICYVVVKGAFNESVEITVLDVNECLETPLVCGPNSVCNNTIGDYNCTCWSGYNVTDPSLKSSANNTCTGNVIFMKYIKHWELGESFEWNLSLSPLVYITARLNLHLNWS